MVFVCVGARHVVGLNDYLYAIIQTINIFDNWIFIVIKKIYAKKRIKNPLKIYKSKTYE